MSGNEKKNAGSKTLSLRGSAGAVRMNLSHGRSKSVVIETKKKKILITNKNSSSSGQIRKEISTETKTSNIKQQNNKNYTD